MDSYIKYIKRFVLHSNAFVMVFLSFVVIENLVLLFSAIDRILFVDYFEILHPEH